MRRTALALVTAVTLLAGCGSTVAVSAADPGASVRAGELPVGISLAADPPVCSRAGESQLCQIGVWYLNGTPDDVAIDATTTTFRDGAGARHDGAAGGLAAELAIPAGGRAKVLWSVKLPYGAVPAAVAWAAPDGSVATARLDGSSSPSASPSASPSETATPSASPTPTPTPTATPKPKPTSAQPRPSSTPTQPGGAIG
ncbi:hypothetical protein [Longivirga aurantiaca]|uniref:DUF4352 domain-containing protein n=1 Tax=Longivirga aurantiaca TaxID=1837743 RepID=A0ABW1T2M4_9ACTN